MSSFRRLSVLSLRQVKRRRFSRISLEVSRVDVEMHSAALMDTENRAGEYMYIRGVPGIRGKYFSDKFFVTF